jgi:hypothetical protein
MTAAVAEAPEADATEEQPQCRGRCGEQLTPAEIAKGRKYKTGHKPGQCAVTITHIGHTDQEVLSALRSLRLVERMTYEFEGAQCIRLEETDETTEGAVKVLRWFLQRG